MKIIVQPKYLLLKQIEMSVYFEITFKNHWIDLLRYSGVSNIDVLPFRYFSTFRRWYVEDGELKKRIYHVSWWVSGRVVGREFPSPHSWDSSTSLVGGGA